MLDPVFGGTVPTERGLCKERWTLVLLGFALLDAADDDFGADGYWWVVVVGMRN